MSFSNNKFWNLNSIALRLLNYQYTSNGIRSCSASDKFPVLCDAWPGFPIEVPKLAIDKATIDITKPIKISNKFFEVNLLIDGIYKKKESQFGLEYYGPDYLRHPMWDMLASAGNEFYTGRVLNYKVNADYQAEVSKVRSEIGSNHVAIATRNLPHKGHLHLVQTMLDKGLSAIVTVTHNPLFENPEIIISGWQKVIKKRDWTSSVKTLGVYDQGFLSGPRDAFWQARIRQRLGFNRFVVGRDHSGIANYFESHASISYLIDNAQKLDITVVPYDGAYFCNECMQFIVGDTCQNHDVIGVSMSGMRKAKMKGVSYEVYSRLVDEEIWELL
jgi:ATP sulfurylase